MAAWHRQVRGIAREWAVHDKLCCGKYYLIYNMYAFLKTKFATCWVINYNSQNLA